jgi:uncharacterized cupredoxin-like copper-binding protein
MPLVRRILRAWLPVAAALVGSSLLASCGGSSAASGATVVEVELGRFTIDPAVLEIPAGDVELKVTNVDENLAHNLVVYGKGTKTLAPGDSQTLEIPDVAVGEHRMWCDVQGHAQMGQVGALVVVPAPAPTSTS